MRIDKLYNKSSIACVILVFQSLCFPISQAEINTNSIQLDIPIIDFPFNLDTSYDSPSMVQSLQFSNGFYKYAHHKILISQQNNPLIASLSLGLFDFISTWLPLGNSWLHEEWHRAVLSQYDINSRNDIYNFNFFSSSIAVSHLKDEDLIRLKSESPSAMIRLHAAGLESQYEQNLALEKDQFFTGIIGNHIVLWLNYLNSSYYLHTCASTLADKFTDQSNKYDNDNLEKRDFTGLDCNAWVYDLFRPDEPYEARGIHPSGVGIDRYIKYSDLSQEEKKFLIKQRNLSFINLLDPFLFGKSRFRGNNLLFWNLTFRHHLTPFGYSIDSNLFFNYRKSNLLLILHMFINSNRGFPGMEVELRRNPIHIRTTEVYISSRIGLWNQPKELLFRTSSAESGGLINFKLSFPISRFIETYIELEGKTKGWVAGNVYLDQSLSLRSGIIGHVF